MIDGLRWHGRHTAASAGDAVSSLWLSGAHTWQRTAARSRSPLAVTAAAVKSPTGFMLVSRPVEAFCHVEIPALIGIDTMLGFGGIFIACSAVVVVVEWRTIAVLADSTPHSSQLAVSVRCRKQYLLHARWGAGADASFFSARHASI